MKNCRNGLHNTALSLVGLLATLVAIPSTAGGIDHPWRLRLAFVAMDSDVNFVDVGASDDGVTINTGVGGGLGVDIRFGSSRWSLNAAVKYLTTTLVATPADGSSGKIDFDPTIIGLGVAYRF